MADVKERGFWLVLWAIRSTTLGRRQAQHRYPRSTGGFSVGELREAGVLHVFDSLVAFC